MKKSSSNLQQQQTTVQLGTAHSQPAPAGSRNGAVQVPFCGRASFRLSRAMRRASRQTGTPLEALPDRYPERRGEVSSLDLSVRSKALKAHLSDAMPGAPVSVFLKRRTGTSRIHISCARRLIRDVRLLASLYADTKTDIIVEALEPPCHAES